jgi:hypothetical protein
MELSRILNDSFIGKQHLLAEPSSSGPSDIFSPNPASRSLPLPAGTSLTPRCACVDDCNLPGPLRRIVSHYFGRNKRGTRAIPESAWVFYCRQHYQRARYRQPEHEYAQMQMRLVRQTVEELEVWGGVTDFTIRLRKRAVLQLKNEKSNKGEHWLRPSIGPQKSFAEVYDVIALVAERSRVRRCPAAEFELVPNIKHAAGGVVARRPRDARNQESSTPLAAKEACTPFEERLHIKDAKTHFSGSCLTFGEGWSPQKMGGPPGQETGPDGEPELDPTVGQR